MKIRYSKNIARDLIIVILLSIILAIFSIAVDINNKIYDILSFYNKIPLAHFLINLIFLLLSGLLFITYRRWRKTFCHEQELKNIIDSIEPNVLLVTNSDGEIIICNETISRLFGYKIDEIIGKNTDILYKFEFDDTLFQNQILENIENSGFHIGFAIATQKDGTKFQVEVITGNLSGGDGSVILIRDITERKIAQDALKFRLEFEKLIAMISTRFINTKFDKIDSEITEALSKITKFLDMDRGYISIYSQKLERMVSAFDWSKTNRNSESDNLMIYKEIPAIYKKIKNIEVVQIQNIDELSQYSDSGKFDIKSCGIKSLINVPMIYAGQLIGLIGFDSYNKEKSWSDEDIALLRMVGEIFVNTIKRKHTEIELMKKTHEFKRSNKELEQFAYIASHDLQEPLRNIKSFVEILSRRYKGKFDSDADDFMGYIVDSVKRMRLLIDDLLQYSRVGSHAEDFEPTDIGRIVENVIDNLRPMIKETGAKITFDSLPTIMADSIQMEQLFQNLIGNAIKFHSEKPPAIAISTDRKNNDWLFMVKDNGIGIPSDAKNKIFVIFQRLHSRDKYVGTGIGLAICKKIVEHHNGKIWVESNSSNGSTFLFTIPIKSERNNNI